MFIDALECSVFDREVIEELRAGELACVTPTLAFWEDAGETMDRIGWWRDFARENSDLIAIARSASEIAAIYEGGRTAILLGTQNSTPLEDRIRNVELFHDMGLRVMQLTYNNQNAIGGSCYEPVDSGLTRFGREVVHEMNRVGMLIDLSHVGDRTGMDVLSVSEKPVAVTHANPKSLYEHARNKSDELLHALAGNGGVIGLAIYPNISGPWISSLERWCEMVSRTIDIVGLDHVGIGTDLARKSDATRLAWMRVGRWTRTVQFGAGSAHRPGPVPPSPWIWSPQEFPAIAHGLREYAHLESAEVAKVMGGNWMRVYGDVLRQSADGDGVVSEYQAARPVAEQRDSDQILARGEHT